MEPSPKLDAKEEGLRRHGALHPHPEAITDPLFAESDFFDSRDVVQVKYEMLRRVRVEGTAISHAAAAFGFSRPTFYEVREAFTRGGIARPGGSRAPTALSNRERRRTS